MTVALLAASSSPSHSAQSGPPLVMHDLPNGDALGRVGRQHAAEERLAVCGHMQRLLKLGGHDAREHLLQADQVVAPVIAPLGKWQDTCTGVRRT